MLRRTFSRSSDLDIHNQDRRFGDRGAPVLERRRRRRRADRGVRPAITTRSGHAYQLDPGRRQRPRQQARTPRARHGCRDRRGRHTARRADRAQHLLPPPAGVGHHRTLGAHRLHSPRGSRTEDPLDAPAAPRALTLRPPLSPPRTGLRPRRTWRARSFRAACHRGSRPSVPAARPAEAERQPSSSRG